MSQRKRWINIGLCLFISNYFSWAWAAQQSGREFQVVSPFMTSEASGEQSMVTSVQAKMPLAVIKSKPTLQDPYEKVNRKIFDFNDNLDTYFLLRISKCYNKVMPKPLNKGIYNFFRNLNSFPTISNDLLQGNFYQATADSWRFFINSTVGAAGLFDIARNIGLEPNTEDFGLTLARWGYTNSNYLVLPFFGSSTVRDAIGLPGDYYFFSPYSYGIDSRTRYTLYALNIISKRAQLLQYQNLYNQIALDRYAFIRNAYLQQRTNEIERNQHLSDPYFNLTNKKSHASGSAF
jgi:phospholipid-binding lipoprotein MlaA